jgi:hypothetical protein
VCLGSNRHLHGQSFHLAEGRERTILEMYICICICNALLNSLISIILAIESRERL